MRRCRVGIGETLVAKESQRKKACWRATCLGGGQAESEHFRERKRRIKDRRERGG
jgi:hypothetical protein